jgi:predicted nucleic acid-binding protein
VIILDTNIISELARPVPEPRVVSWLDSLSAEETAITAITAAELWYGVLRLPAGRRKNELSDIVHAIVNADFHGRIEPFDVLAATQYAEVVAERDRIGRPISTPDAQIAAICRVLAATLATRNTPDFTGTGIALIDPWEPAC